MPTDDKHPARRPAKVVISYHEAGHAVVARKLGVEITGVDMTANNERLANVQTRSATWVALQGGGDQVALARGLYADLMVAVAGVLAQELAGYPARDDFTPEGEFGRDIDNAIDHAWRLARIEAGLPIEFGPDEPEELHPGDPLHTAGVAIIKRAAAETKVLLRDNWLAVVRVAGAFVKHDRLTQTELDHATALAPQA